MNPTDYVNKSMSTNLTEEDYTKVLSRLADLKTLQILHALMGITTESGEMMDALKKHLIYGRDLDIVNLMEEHGDLFWYCALLAKACGFSFENSMQRNYDKLRARYPGKFTEEAALNRNLDAERKILEGNDAASKK